MDYTVDFDGAQPFTYEIMEGTLSAAGGQTGDGVYGGFHLAPPGETSTYYWNSFVVIDIPSSGTITNIAFDFWHDNTASTDSIAYFSSVWAAGSEPTDKWVTWLHDCETSALECHGTTAGSETRAAWHTNTQPFSTSCAAGCRVVVWVGQYSGSDTYDWEYKLDDIVITVTGGPTPTPTSTPHLPLDKAPTATPDNRTEVPKDMPTLVPTSTEPYKCPGGVNPFGYGYVTPSADWEAVCGACLQGGGLPTVSPGSCDDTSCGGFDDYCSAIRGGSLPDLPDSGALGDPNTFQIPGLHFGEETCVNWAAWELDYDPPLFGVSHLEMEAVEICAVPVSFDNLVFYGFVIPVDAYLTMRFAVALLKWLWRAA